MIYFIKDESDGEENTPVNMNDICGPLGERIDFGYNTEYITPSNGYVLVGGYGSGTYVYLYIDGIIMANVRGTDAASSDCTSIFVGKGRTVKVAGTNSSMANTNYFVPIES